MEKSSTYIVQNNSARDLTTPGLQYLMDDDGGWHLILLRPFCGRVHICMGVYTGCRYCLAKLPSLLPSTNHYF